MLPKRLVLQKCHKALGLIAGKRCGAAGCKFHHPLAEQLSRVGKSEERQRRPELDRGRACLWQDQAQEVVENLSPKPVSPPELSSQAVGVDLINPITIELQGSTGVREHLLPPAASLAPQDAVPVISIPLLLTEAPGLWLVCSSYLLKKISIDINDIIWMLKHHLFLLLHYSHTSEIACPFHLRLANYSWKLLKCQELCVPFSLHMVVLNLLIAQLSCHSSNGVHCSVPFNPANHPIKWVGIGPWFPNVSDWGLFWTYWTLGQVDNPLRCIGQQVFWRRYGDFPGEPQLSLETTGLGDSDCPGSTKDFYVWLGNWTWVSSSMSD